MISKLHHSDYTLKNRAFNCRMRNRYYEEVYYAFRAIFPNDVAERREHNPAADTIWFQNLSKEIKRYERLIMTCLEYAQAAIFYARQKTRRCTPRTSVGVFCRKKSSWFTSCRSYFRPPTTSSLESRPTRCYRNGLVKCKI